VKTVLVTGARGFIGRNLNVRLRQNPDLTIRELSRENAPSDLEAWAGEADVIVHLAGVNRPSDPAEFQAGNVGFTERLLAVATKSGNRPHLILASSIQAALDNPYGISKRGAEQAAARWAEASGARVTVMRLRNVFGKWCRPNYNSVVATFCHNIARGLSLRIDNPATMLELVHVDDVCESIMRVMSAPPAGPWTDDLPAYRISLGDLAERLRAFDARATTLQVPDMSERFNRLLYGTFITYLEPKRWEYLLEKKVDPRGDLAEFVKSPAFGQIFVSRTKPGITRGNHYHHAKVEKFLVISGSAIIRFRHVEGAEVIDFPVRGEDYRVVEIPPGFTHSITNVGDSEMITLFWANEVFDPERPDTTFLTVEPSVTAAHSR
jgi:UDP-2-acetamido-2,6-beta-L-arabino-hexul-4-ose reductase